jgi:hypothetical protein
MFYGFVGGKFSWTQVRLENNADLIYPILFSVFVLNEVCWSNWPSAKILMIQGWHPLPTYPPTHWVLLGG